MNREMGGTKQMNIDMVEHEWHFWETCDDKIVLTAVA